MVDINTKFSVNLVPTSGRCIIQFCYSEKILSIKTSAFGLGLNAILFTRAKALVMQFFPRYKTFNLYYCKQSEIEF